MEDNNGEDKYNISDGFKWVIIYEGPKNFNGGVFTDMKQASDFVGVSESTFKRRSKASDVFFRIDNYKVLRLPYYKSKRGAINNE